MKKAFTLIEMLVVVGIIAVLAAIVLANIRGATDAANAVKCMSNMRNLVNAANSLAVKTDSFPLAGMAWRTNYTQEGESSDEEQPAWVSFDRSKNKVPCYGAASDDDNVHALTNGSHGFFWKATDCNAGIYNCPMFVKDHLVKRKRKPVFSYVLNGRFAYDGHYDYQSWDWDGVGIVRYRDVTRTDRMLMFAELPISQSCDYNPLAQIDTCDCTLQFKKSGGGRLYGNNEWGGRSESIGFVHQDKRKRYYGHVAFVDGHVEKFMQPPTGSALKADWLTAYLCAGCDVSFDDEKGYRFVDEVIDETNEDDE